MGLPALIEDLVQEILLRVPPEDPSHLIRASVVCKSWRRILSDGGFRRRYCTFHQTRRPLLGYICNLNGGAGLEFVKTTSFFPPSLAASRNSSLYRGSRAIDCRHGRVLIDEEDTSASGGGGGGPPGFVVWDPITGDRQHLSFPAENLCSFYTGAVLCAVDGCDHLDCHGGPFLVVLLGETERQGAHAGYVWASVYSSETGQWSAQTSSSGNNSRQHHYPVTNTAPSLLIGGALYFTSFEIDVRRILKYDLTRHELSMIGDTPESSHKTVAVDIDGGLGLVEAYLNTIYIYTWSQQQQGDGIIGRWVQVQHDNNVVMELNTLITPQHRRSLYYIDNPGDVVRFVEGTNTILFSLDNYIGLGVFTLDLKTRTIRKVAETWDNDILPYTCFYTPGLAKGKLSQ